MTYKNLTVYDFQNKLNGLLPIYDTNLSLLGISESPGYSNQLCTATSEHIGILQNLQNANFLTLYYKTSQSSDSTRRLYDEYESAASIIQAEQTVTYGVNNSDDYLNRAYISYTGDPNSGYSTEYSYAINDHIWSTTYMGVGYCLGLYEAYSTFPHYSPSSEEYSYTAEQQYKYLFTNFSIGGYEMTSEQNSSSYLMYYTFFKSSIGNCTISNIGSASWQSINSNSESYPSGSTNISGSMGAFNWDSTALSSYNNAYYNRSWPSYHTDITGMQRSTLQQWTSYVTQSDIESQLNHYISHTQGDGFIKYLYSPKDPGDVICGRINGNNDAWRGLSVDGNNNSIGYTSFNVFSSFNGFNSDLNNYHYTPIWVYAAYDITQCRNKQWYYRYLLMTQVNRYYNIQGSDSVKPIITVTDGETLSSAGLKKNINFYYNGRVRNMTFYRIFKDIISSERCMGYVVIPVALILVCYVVSTPANFQSSFLASSINNVQSTNNTYVYPKFSYETYDAFETSTNYRQSINTVVTKVVKCGSSSDTRYLMDFSTPIYWNSTSSHFANACLGVPYSPIIYR